ncbi:MAG: HAD family hydrolase [Gammaproteobacteria bacterium]
MSTRLVLFDLDGTLLDTAPDLAAALNLQRAEHKLAPLPFARIRPEVSHGSPALLRLGFGIRHDDSRYAGMRARLLAIYRERLSRETRFFPGTEALLASIEQRGLRWGVVTNKPAALTEPLLDAFQLRERAVCVVCADSCVRRKPEPDGLLRACAFAATAPAESLYVGDAREDVLAAHAAGMSVALALYGYLGADDEPGSWQADYLLSRPADLLAVFADPPAIAAARPDVNA